MLLRGLFVLSLVFSFSIGFSQKLFEDQIDVNSGKGVDKKNAVIYLPAHYSKQKAYPLVIFTHGMGEAGNDVKKLYKQGLPKVLKKGYRPPFDFIMVAVQSNAFSLRPEWLQGILKESQKRWKIDASRIYLTGLSAGGWSVYGSQLNISPAFAKRFAAIVVNSGVTGNIDKNHFDWWKQTKTPLWAIVGGADKSYVKGNTYMVNEINKRVPGLAKLTIRRGIGHGGWTDIYNGKVELEGKNMWEWLYQFKRTSSGTTKPPVEETPAAKEDDSADVSKPVVSYNYIKVNVYSGINPISNHTWNNWNVGASQNTNITARKFTYNDGSASNISAVLSSNYETVDNGANYGAGNAPADVLRYTSYSMSKRTLTLTGLSRTKKYNIHLYGSRSNRPGNSTRYTINGESHTIATNNNHTEKAFFGNLTPDANGRIVITIENLKKYNYLNGFMLVEIDKSARR